MTQIVVSAEMAKQIGAADGPVNVVDAAGTVIAVCTPVKLLAPHRFPPKPSCLLALAVHARGS